MPSTLTGEQPVASQSSANRKRRWLFSATLLVVAIVYLSGSFGPMVFDELEGQYTGAAREMLDSGRWLIPTNDGVPRLQKPPLVYWILRISFGLFGVNEFAARLPNALATIGWTLAVGLLGTRVGGSEHGALAMAIFASMTGTFVFAHLIMPEPFLGLFITLAFWCLLRGYESELHRRAWYAGAWLCMAGAVLSKGLHGALIPLLAVAGVCCFNASSHARWKGLFRLDLLFLFGLAVVPWYLAVEHRFPGFIKDHFLNEQLGHLFDRRFPRDSDPVPAPTFWLEHLAFFLPWTVFVPGALWSRWRGRTNMFRRTGATLPVPMRLLTVWVVVTVAGVMFSARQDYYTMTCWGAVAIWLAGLWSSRARSSGRELAVPSLVLGGVGLGVLGLAGWLAATTPSGPIQAQSVGERGAAAKAISGFSIQAWHGFAPKIALAGLSVASAGVIAARLSWRQRPLGGGFVLAAGMVAPMVTALGGLSLMAPYFSLAPIASALRASAPGHALIVCEGEPDASASLFFYLNRPITWVMARPNQEFALRYFRLGLDHYLDSGQFIELWHSGRQVYFILEETRWPFWRDLVGVSGLGPDVLARSGTRVLLVNRKNATPPPRSSGGG